MNKDYKYLLIAYAIQALIVLLVWISVKDLPIKYSIPMKQNKNPKQKSSGITPKVSAEYTANAHRMADMEKTGTPRGVGFGGQVGHGGGIINKNGI